MTVTSAAAVTAERRQLLAKVHVAKSQLALDDGTYREILRRITGTESAKLASDSGLIAVIKELKAKGWSDQRRGRGADARDQARKLRALWIALWQLGHVARRDDDALAAFVSRQTGRQALRWNDPRDLAHATECLKGWCKRVGYEPAPFHAEVLTPGEGRYEAGLIEAQWTRLAELGAFDRSGGHHGRLDTWLTRMGWPVAAPQFLAPDAAIKAVQDLGIWIRRLLGKKAEDDAAPA